MLYQCVSLVYNYFLMYENKSIFNQTVCQLLTEKPNCTKLLITYLLWAWYHIPKGGGVNLIT
jgi:hypothetical protein